MKTLLARAIGATAILCAAFGAQASDDAPYGKLLSSTEAVAQSRPGSFDVYIDAPTGFAFVNTPTGWVFTRKVQDDSPVLAELRAREDDALVKSAALSQQ